MSGPVQFVNEVPIEVDTQPRFIRRRDRAVLRSYRFFEQKVPGFGCPARRVKRVFTPVCPCRCEHVKIRNEAEPVVPGVWRKS